MAKYKPGQLFTYNKRIYRVMKKNPNEMTGTCNRCRLYTKWHNELCNAEGPQPKGIFECYNLVGEPPYYPQFIRINPLCVKN